MVNTSEFFHLWVIETDYDLEKELPFSKAGLNVIVTPDQLERYRTRKVRILNGAHTSMVAYGLLSGLETVKDCMDDDTMKNFVRACLFEEIIPTLDMPRDELLEYADSVLVRFSNPYIRHFLAAISLNSISKFKVRVLPSLLEYRKRFGKNPEHLILGLAKLIEFYQTGTPNDAEDVIAAIRGKSLEEILANTALWGADISDLADAVKAAK
jgi:tagaturonate reductase